MLHFVTNRIIKAGLKRSRLSSLRASITPEQESPGAIRKSLFDNSYDLIIEVKGWSKRGENGKR
tara:strand:- start:385 stop:576 length:192 start_codon:yes stop_codon:yes gene_type:complete